MESENNYYDHYKDTWSLQQTYLSERNKLTVTLLILLVLVAGIMYEPAMIPEKVNVYLNSRVKGLAFDMKYLNTGLIFLLLWIMTRYYQAVIKIERMYRYLKDCENKLSAENTKYVINREGAYYSKSKPLFTRVINFCYVFLLPLAIIAIAIIKIKKECRWTSDFKVVDFIGLSLIILLSLLYISNRWFKKKENNKEEDKEDKKE